uniref:Calponin-homology (CH) domain-containing protein n=1 Tax=Fagus sylvatica TaxID=28930 RepID=A0A2N9F0U2_FAGSY
MDGEEPPFLSPSPYLKSSSTSSSSSLLKDISNFKTPKRPSQIPIFHSPCPQFFTASKRTPCPPSSFHRRHRTSLAPSSSAHRSKSTARKLKAFELEQSKSSRKAQIQKQNSLKSLSKSLTVWLNFLFENPRSCGCDLSICGDGDSGFVESVLGKGKRDSGSGIGIGVDVWRGPKRHRDLLWKREVENVVEFPNSMFSNLRSSLKDVCSFDDLKLRMRAYLSLGSCKEIFEVMTRVNKNIDEGRLKMKAHCAIVTDVGLKEKATRILMSYNPIWLRIGLYIIFGGDSLLSNVDVNSDQEIAFLKMVIEKQFFSHGGLAKAYAYNKMVEGLYRPGYYESLGNVILKRFLLLVLILDRAKCQSSLPLKYGIDGVDGGSPLLFTVQASIKSSRQVIHDFLSSDIMHGEGNILAHLVIVGYKLSYQQCPLIEYDFRVTDLFVDLQDGVRLCRAIQLLQHDSSILTKMVVPSDTRKKNLANCGFALQNLRQAGVSLCDEDGMTIVGDDVANGDKELTLSLLWNIFVHLQLPLLVNKTILLEEICKVRGINMGNSNTVNSAHLDMLLNWIQAICENYGFKIEKFSSLVDGKAIWCLLDYYFRKDLHCACSLEDPQKASGKESIMSAIDYPDAVHNFIFSQKLTTLLGNFPEVLQISDILEYNGACNDQSVAILLVFLASQLNQLNFHKFLGCDCITPERKHSCLERCSVSSEAVQNQEETDWHSTEDAVRKFKAIQTWWQNMAEQNYKPVTKVAPLTCLSPVKDIISIHRENAAKVIQSHVRRLIERRNFLMMVNAVSFLQIVIRAWLTVKKSSCVIDTVQVEGFSSESLKQSERCRRYFNFIVDRHSFVKLKRSVLLIQQAARNWINRRHHGGSIGNGDVPTLVQVNAATVVQKYSRGWLARSRYIHGVPHLEKASNLGASDLQSKAAGASSLHAVIPSGCLLKSSRVRFRSIELEILFCSALKVQRWWKGVLLLKLRAKSAVIIQSHIRAWFARRNAAREKHLIVFIQSYWKGYLTRKELRGQLLDLRLRVQKSSTNVDDSRRLINRLLSAVSELLSMKSVSGILHTCATLDMATEHSQKCCEELVAAGAINTLLKLIRSVSRSIPDQEVLKHALSTLRNLARYPHLVEVLIDCHGSVEIIFWEFLRSKEEGYFIASELLKKICSTHKGVEAMRKLPTHLKRLHSLVEELTRKASNERRNARGPTAARDNIERRLREAVEVLKVTANGQVL